MTILLQEPDSMTLDNEALPECDEVDITEADLLHDEELEHYLITSAFSPIEEIYVLEPKHGSKV